MQIAATRTARELAELGRRIPTGAPEWDAYARRMEDRWGHAAGALPLSRRRKSPAAAHEG